MDTALRLSPEIRGTNTQAANTGTTTATSGPITEGIQSMLTQETLGKMGQIDVDGREEEISQLQGTQPAGLQTHQRLPPPEVSQLFQVLAGVIERQPAILEALQQFVARFVPLPQEVLNDPPQHKHRDPSQYPRSRENNDRSRSPRRPTTGDREAESYQEVQQMKDDGRFPSANPKPQDDGWASQSGASTYSTSQGPTPSQFVPSAPLTATSVSQTDDDQEWPLPGASSQIRKRSPQATEKDDRSIPGSFPVQTVVLRSVGKKEVGAFTGKEIRNAIQHAGIHAQADYSVHRNEKANALSITTRDPNYITEKLMTIKKIRKGDEDNTFQPYKALAGNECRGVVYLRGEGNEVSPAQLLEDIMCRTQKVVAARPLGKKGNVILVTFQGKACPKRVSYMHEVPAVREYRPRPLVCFQCHAIGHKMDVCPRKGQRCETCGSEHDGMEECTKDPKCANCDGAHVATSNECPKRAIPPRRTAKKTTRTEERSKKPKPLAPAALPVSQDAGVSYAAVTMGAFQPTSLLTNPPQQMDMPMQMLQLQYAGFARVEKQLSQLTAAIHKLIGTRSDG
ncbi:hypothetical protein HPB47_003869 [Ixodes persulcatus]|uniref:Uncharacterized protein n=1 Tax=Ixodes persulcatus TaxID=34615 RepID=A0AC60PHD2_IXOPE|nr:hypothetical protein HPB47_003869 [Ixodes persulcatus]